MIGAGLLGGAINHFLAEEAEKEGGRRLYIGRDLLVGLGAAFAVPLFLNMISSNLLERIHGDAAKGPEADKLLVFAGFCLIAAISSRAFIRTLSDRILKEAREARSEARSAEEKAEQLQASVAPILEKETEADDLTQQGMQGADIPEFTDEEIKLLRALASGKYTLRSLSGLASETNLARADVHRILDDLLARGFVAQRDQGKGRRWFITTEGRRAAKEHI